MAETGGWSRELSWCKKAAIVAGSGVALGLGLYSVIWYRKKCIGSEGGGMTKEFPEKRILVLGLDNSGKSSLLRRLTKSENEDPPEPTEGFNVMCVQKQAVTLNIWEVGGQESVRSYWENFVKGTDVLVFVVDAVDRSRFPEAREELQKLLVDERLAGVPLVLIANKQDQPTASRGADFISALDSSTPSEHEVHVVETQTVLSEGSDNIQQVMHLMTSLSKD